MWISKLHFHVSDAVFAELVSGRNTVPLKTATTDTSVTYTLANDSKIVCLRYSDCEQVRLWQIDWQMDIRQELPGDFCYEGVLHTFKYAHTTSALVKQDTPVRTNPSQFHPPCAVRRINTPRPVEPRLDAMLGLSHVGLFVSDVEAAKEIFSNRGFLLSDCTPGHNAFFRSGSLTPHHQLLLVSNKTNPDPRCNLHHLAISVEDVATVFTEGLGLTAKGLKTVLGPGRHVISSATFWYFHTALGTIELCADEDLLTESWQPRELSPGAKISEWVASLSDIQTRVTSNEP